MLNTHTGTTKDTRGTEFQYTCYTQKDRAYMEDTDGKYRFKDVLTRDYIVYDGHGTGKLNIIAEANTLKELKVKMGTL